MTGKSGRSRISWQGARNGLLCGLLAFVGVQVALNLALERWHPDEYDAEYVERRDLLRARHAEQPERPLALLMGSSRMVMGFAPERLERSQRSDGPLVVNFARFGQGPLLNSVTLKRLERDGLLPRYVAFEVVPAYLCRESPQLLIGNLAAAELAHAARYLRPSKVLQHFVLRRLEIGPRYGERLLGLRQGPTISVNNYHRLGGYRHVQQTASPSFRREKMAVTRHYFYENVAAFKISASEDRALRDCLEFCKQRGIKTALFLSPEGSQLRSWYAADAESKLQAYLADLQRAHDFQLIDARAWLPDDEFYDDHHPLQAGAETLTRRLEREVLAPLLDQELLAVR